MNYTRTTETAQLLLCVLYMNFGYYYRCSCGCYCHLIRTVILTRSFRKIFTYVVALIYRSRLFVKRVIILGTRTCATNQLLFLWYISLIRSKAAATDEESGNFVRIYLNDLRFYHVQIDKLKTAIKFYLKFNYRLSHPNRNARARLQKRYASLARHGMFYLSDNEYRKIRLISF